MPPTTPNCSNDKVSLIRRSSSIQSRQLNKNFNNSPFNDLPIELDMNVLNFPPPDNLTPDSKFCLALMSLGPPLPRQFVECIEKPPTFQLIISPILGLLFLSFILTSIFILLKKSIKVKLRVIK